MSSLLGQPAYPGSTLIVVSDAGYSRRQRMVHTRCQKCGASVRQRLSDATSGHANCCGCMIEAFFRHYEAAVLLIPKDVSYEIYTALVTGKVGRADFRGTVEEAIAAAHGITPFLVAFIKRDFDQRIDALKGRWSEIYDKAHKRNASMPDIVAEFDLPPAAIRHILTLHEKPAAQQWRLEEKQIDDYRMAEEVM